jgi:hypothetical protein
MSALNEKITLTVDGQPREFSAAYLTPAVLEYWQAWLAHEARAAHNPFEEFAAKVQALPEDLRRVATREFVAGMNFDVVPKLVLLETLHSLPAMKTLAIMVTGQDCVSPENWEAAFPLLLPFILRQEIVTDSIEEANRIRAQLGKPPLGRPAAAKPPQGG